MSNLGLKKQFMDPLRRFLREQLYKRRFLWIAARWYVRYAPKGAVSAYLNFHVNGYFISLPHSFVTRTRAGFNVEGETSDLIQRFIYLFGVWEPGLTAWLSKRLQPGDVFIDVGANIGYYSLLAAKLVGEDGGVVAVEASPEIFGRLAKNVARNNARHIRLVNEAAFDRKSSIRIFRGPAGNLGATSTFSDEGFEFEAMVDARPLFEILSRDEVHKARIIKIDVEGVEVQALCGLLPALSHTRNDLEIIIEVGGGPRTAPGVCDQAAEVVRMLSQRGFHVYRIGNSFDPQSYIRESLSRPQRVRGTIDSESDLVFSRVDAEVL